MPDELTDVTNGVLCTVKASVLRAVWDALPAASHSKVSLTAGRSEPDSEAVTVSGAPWHEI